METKENPPVGFAPSQMAYQARQTPPPPYPPQAPPAYTPGYVYSNPGHYGTTPPVHVIDRTHEAEHVQDNLILSVVSIFFCCILGIIATIKAVDSRDAKQRGDVDGAIASSGTARKLALAAIVIGCVLVVVNVTLRFMVY